MTLFICDSRGKGLEQHITKYTSDNVSVSINSGATLYQSVTRSRNLITRIKPRQIYILSGINNLTTMDKITRKVTVTERNPFKASDIFEEELREAYTYIHDITHSRIEIITAPITGMSLATYNGCLPSNPNDQYSLNEAVTQINKKIISLNEENGCSTPWTSAIVHRYFRKKHNYAYHRLSDDGCHLSEEVKDFWGRKLADAVINNM